MWTEPEGKKLRFRLDGTVATACSKIRFRLDVRKYVFSNRVVDRWNQLPEKCIKCSTVNTLKSTSQLSWNWKVIVCYEDSGRYMAKACVDLCHQLQLFSRL